MIEFLEIEGEGKKMTKDDIIEYLSKLAVVREVISSAQQELGELENQAFLNCPDLNVRRDEILQELKVIGEKGSKFTNEINEAILEKKESVKGKLLHAVFSKARTSWDIKALEGYAAAHPEIEKLKKTGSPSVAIREVKGR